MLRKKNRERRSKGGIEYRNTEKGWPQIYADEHRLFAEQMSTKTRMSRIKWIFKDGGCLERLATYLINGGRMNTDYLLRK